MYSATRITSGTYQPTNLVRRTVCRCLPPTLEHIEPRLLLSAAFDAVGLTALRADPAFAGIDGSAVGIAILDSGVFSQHPDLRNNFVAWYDAVERTGNTSPIDPDGHGTHVAGTAASSNPAIGVATRARLIGVRALPNDNERPRHDTVAEALNWVLDHQAEYNIRVVNMSLGVPSHNFNVVPDQPDASGALIRRLERRGVTVVTASGNGYADFATTGASTPAVFSSLSVASTWEDNGTGDSFPLFSGSGGPFAAFEREGRRDRFAASSQRSTLPNQVAAPGQTIFSTWNGDGGQLFNTISGTSMASPLVAGMVALMQDAAQTFGGRYLTTSEVVSVVRETGDVIVDSNVTTNGRIELATRQVRDLPETGQSFRRVNINNAVRRVRMMLTGSDSPGTIIGDADNTIVKSINLGTTNAMQVLTSEGLIGTDGQFSAAQSDVDLFRFELLSPGALNISVAQTAGGDGFDSYLRLFDASGTEIAANDDADGSVYSRIQTGLLQPGVYFAGVSSFGNGQYNILSGAGANGESTGSYTITISLGNPDPDGIASGATIVAELPSLTQAGSIGFDGDVNVGGGDVDFFLITAPDTGTLTIDVDTDDLSDGADAMLRVFNVNLLEIASNDDRAPGVIDPRIELSAVKGQQFFVSVSDYENAAFDPTNPYGRPTVGAGGAYDLFMFLLNGDQNGTVFSSVRIDAGAGVSGSIGSDFGSPLIGEDGSKDVDFLSFQPTTSGVLDLQVSSPDGSLRPVISLWRYDAVADDMLVIGESTGETDGTFAAVLRTFVEGGFEYFLSITGIGNGNFAWYAPATGAGGDTGNYALTTALRPLSFANSLVNNSVQQGSPTIILLGQQLSAEVGADGDFALDGTDVDIFRFTATVSQALVFQTFTTAEDATDTVLRLFDSAGNQLIANDDISADNRRSRVRFSVQAGQTYFIGINGYSDQAFDYNPLTGFGAADGELGAYVLSVGLPPAPEIEVLSASGVAILSGDTVPNNADGTRFGQAAVLGLGGGPVVRSFTIVNSGSRTLQLNGPTRVQVVGPAASDFTIVSQPSASISANTTAVFEVRFSPTAGGNRRATIQIATNDADESTFSFALIGSGVNRPEIDLQGFANGGSQARAIRSGDTTPRLADGTRFGSIRVGNGLSNDFVIKNLGRRALRLTGSTRVQITGDAASDFVVVQQPSSQIGSGLSARFALRFTPAAIGARQAIVTIASNDLDEGTYSFTVSGFGTA